MTKNDLTVLGDDGIERSYDEHYDTLMEVVRDPAGAWLAIREQAERIKELETLVSELSEELQLEKNGFIAMHGEEAEEGLMDILSKEILNASEEEISPLVKQILGLSDARAEGVYYNVSTEDARKALEASNKDDEQ